MYEVRIEKEFSAAHFLKDYNGKCENLHGHNYTVRVHLKGEKLNDGGLLFDFSLLKKITKAVLEKLDHKNLNDIAFFEENPSAERIAKYIFDNIILLASENNFDLTYKAEKKDAFLSAVDVFETKTSRARFSI